MGGAVAAAGSVGAGAEVGAGAATAVPIAPHPPVGIGEAVASHANGYVQPVIAVTLLAVSLGSAHPSSAETVAAVNVGGGSVIIASVLVYCGRSVMLGGGTFEMSVGGQIPYVSTEVATIVPAPAPPVCQDWNDPLNGA